MTRFTFSAAFFLFASLALVAQTGDYTQIGIPQNSPTIPIPLGFIAPLTGQVHLEIPVTTMPIRGAGGPLQALFSYDTSSYSFSGYGGPHFVPSGNGMDLTVQSSEDAGLINEVVSGAGCPSGYTGRIIWYSYFRILDKRGVHYVSSSNNSPPKIEDVNCEDQYGHLLNSPTQTISAPSEDGQYYFLLKAGNNNHIDYLSYQYWKQDGVNIVDTNGNLFCNDCQPGGIPGEYTTNPITYNGGNGGCGYFAQTSSSQTVTLTASGQSLTINCTAFPTNGIFLTLLTSIVLPDGTQYTFTYDPNHLYILNGVTLPTGGQLSFNYSTSTQLGWSGITSATFGGGTWNFSSSYGSGGSHVISTTVTAPPRYDYPSQSYVTDKTVYTSNAWAGLLARPPLVTQIQYYSGSSTLLKTVNAAYTTYPTDPAPYGCLKSLTTTLNDTNQTSTVQYQYGASCLLMTQKQEFDYGATSPTRTTTVSYLADTSSINYNSQYHIYDRPVSVSVYAGTSSGTLISQTNYTYDEYGANYCNSVPMLTNVTGALSHDDAGHGINFTARGNVTSISRLVSGSTYVTSHVCYDTLGNVTQQVDGVGNPTNYDYTENWADTNCIASGTITRLFASTVTDALGHRTRTTRYSCTGSPSAVADENDLQATRSGSTYTYDWANRPLCINYTDGGQTCNSYFMTAQPAYATQTTLIASGLSKTAKTVLDGYGRTIQAQLTSDPSGIDFTDTAYDNFGRVASLSNPYRSTADTTYGITYSYYDALGRPVAAVEPDGSAINTSYTGNCQTATDEAGKTRKSCVDGLGRVTGVWEDPSGLNYETDYLYDALGNLIKVTQNGNNSANARIRTFTYDGLSKLVCAANPEIQAVTCPGSATSSFPNGAVTYSYDADGNVITKTSPSPNQPSTGTAKVTTTYSYDKLNRLTGKSYTDTYTQNPATPTVTYGYDGVVPSGCTPPTVASPTNSGIPVTPTNVIGRRSSMCDGSGTTAWVYDSMGRPTIEERKLNGVTKSIGYTYYLDGNQHYLWYPSDDRMAYDVSAAGRTIGVEDGLDNYVFDNATFTPGGALASMAQYTHSGSFSVGIGTELAYNNRQQLMLEYSNYTGVSGTVHLFERCYDYHQTQNLTFGGITCSASATSPGDNGNIYQITNKLDDTRTQNFTYDSLNRISQANTNGSNWGQAFTIDAWGNLTAVGAVSGKAPVGVFTTTASTKNQLSCTTGCTTSYDAAGNTLTDGNGGITYDAENRIHTAGGVTYTYDGDGKRVEKSNGTLYWTGVGSDALSESNLSGNINEEYVFFDGKRASRIDRPSNTVHSFLVDHLGSSRMMVVASGTNALTVEQDVDYTPYGIVATGSAADPHQFTGKERDAESGLDDFDVRYFGSSLGRFMTPDDPLMWIDQSNPQSLNLYAYALNGPTNKTDDGHDCVYLNNTGKDVDSVDINSSREECEGPNHSNGGYWVDGSVTQVNLYYNSNDVFLVGEQLDSRGDEVGTASFYSNVTPFDQSIYSAMGMGIPTGTIDLIPAFRRAQGPQFQRQDPLDVAIECGGSASLTLTKEVTGVSLLEDTADALVAGSLSPFTPHDAAEITEKVADTAEGSQAAKGAIRSLARSMGSKISKKAAGKLLGHAGKAAGYLGTGIALYNAGSEFTHCVK